MIRTKKYIITLIILMSGISLFAQDTTSSLAFKNNRPPKRPNIFYHPDLSYQLWHQFKLLQEANDGNALAQHELGIRYLVGRGFPADTVKAAYWIGKAADQNLTAACYNYAILLNNGWGVKWNPFKAYDYFMTAAKDDMPMAEYVIGLTYIDDLVVKRDWTTAYLWIKKSADSGYKPAKKTLREIKKRIPKSVVVDTNKTLASSGKTKNKFKNQEDNTPIAPSTGLVFIDFSTATDSVAHISNRMLLDDLRNKGNDSLAAALNLDEKKDTTLNFNEKSLRLLEKFAEYGSPEALTLLGRMYELGVYFEKDLVKAADYYIRASRLDSPRSPALLWKMTRRHSYYDTLKTLVDNKDPEAMFAWYGLFTLGFDYQFTQADAVSLLKNAAALQFIPAMNEMGLNYFTGKMLPKDQDKAVKIWELAESLGSKEAVVRLAIANIYGYSGDDGYENSIKNLYFAADSGSVLAQVTLAYCFEHGIGVNLKIPEAVRYFRFAAQRGSRYAFDELKRLYDSVRPNNSIFRLN